MTEKQVGYAFLVVFVIFMIVTTVLLINESGK